MGVTGTEVARATRERILNAAFEAVADFGLSRLTMEDVATRADCSRQTLYRYFPARDDLLGALVLREEERLLDGVRGILETTGDLRGGVRAAVAFVLTSAREHPLLDRLLRTDPAILLPYLTVRSGPLVSRAREVLIGVLAEREPQPDPATLEGVADAAARLLLSHILNPTEHPDAVAEALADILVRALTRREP